MDVFFIKFGGGYMRWLINDKGMLFGNRINIIDLMVAIFFLCLTPMFWFGYKLFKPQLKTTIEIQISEYEQLGIINARVKDFCREHKRASICK